MRTQALTLVVLATFFAPHALAEGTKPAIGARVDNFSLRDFHGKSYSLDELGKDKVTVLAFLGTECPLAKIYAARLVDLAEKFAPRGVVLVGINSNRQDAVTEIASFARVHKIPFPILKDLNQVVADSVGATRTPEVVVLDAERAIRYRGRVDDQYGFNASNANYQKQEPDKNDLADALEALVAGKTVAAPEVATAGCLIGRDLEPVADSEVTYSNQIARIMNANCVFCHREGQIAPFTLTSYDDVSGWASMIDEVVRLERMPPWHASEKYGHFENDARLSDGDKAMIANWVKNGAPEGDPADLPEPPTFAEGWMIPEPDQVLYMRDEPYDVPATGVVEYQMFVVDPGWTEDKWITAIEPRPGNPSVVHHILLFVIPPDGNITSGIGGGNDFLGAFAPGLRPESLPEGMARYVPAGSKLVFQLHYTPNGSPQQDRSYCGFAFADAGAVKKEVRVTSAVNAVFQIPPGESDFDVKSRFVFTDDALLLTMMPHMHLRGKAFRYEATYPDGNTEVLLDVPRYDFGWQTNYRLSEPKLMPRGTRIDCYAVFDNSADNLNNPDPKAAVRFGDQTWEEMMIGFFEATPAHEDRQNPAQAAPEPSRLERFNLILAATKGELDDNIKIGAYMAMADPGIFRQYGMILRTMVPQVDRLCITAVKDGKLVEWIGPQSGPDDDEPEQGGEEEVEQLIIEARKKAADGKIASSIGSPLEPVDAAGEGLAEVAAATKVVVHNDLSQVPGKVFDEMRKRGAKSSLHVPAEIKGMRVTINFWSKDAGAFPPPAEAILTGIAQIMTAPKDADAQAAAK
jgi:peroxiredoxin